ncbi:MAG: hypothetical protein IJO83_05630 [Clostridia bacterium]|nr:hypothetical protein [Clostridia bacterium]
MNKRLKALVTIVVAVLLLVALVAIWGMEKRDGDVDSIEDVRDMAEAIYAEGDVEGAIYHMEVYCTYVSTDTEARAILGDWYMETGDEEKAYECYYAAASYKELSEERIPALSVKNTEEIVLEPINEVVLEITPDVRETKDMFLTITGHNLVPETVYEGRINAKERELTDEEGFLTTDWFSVDPEGEYLTMSGGFNRAMWQFKNAEGEITHYAVSNNTYRKKDTYSVNVYQMARAAIPEKSAWCRVTYYDRSLEGTTVAHDEKLTIVYGRLPGESHEADYATYEIPDLKEGESILYTNGVWSHVKNGQATVLEGWRVPSIERGSYMAIGGTLPGRVSLEKSKYADFSKEGIYSVRFDVNNPSAMGERCDDAKNFGFNAAVSESTIALGENHFDNVYPWKDIKLCNVKDGNIIYDGEEGFSSSGTNGDVFVEIPKFYVKRTFDGVYDTISISGFRHEGFVVDEAFLKENGEEADAVYVAAYLTSIDENGMAVSVADVNPALNRAPIELSMKAMERGYKEIDYHTLAALQKLFMVETGLRNSQYLYLGACGYTTASGDKDSGEYPVALASNEKTNCVVVADSYHFQTGNSVVIFDADDYGNTIDAALNDIREVKTVIDNNDGTQSVYITGDPIDVFENKTAIAHTALKNGSARNVSGHTGAISTARGTVAFKYRNMENFWGNAFVYIDGVAIKDRRINIKKRDGRRVTLSYMLPETSEDNPFGNVVRSVGYDASNPLVMLPDSVGGDASISTYFGDAFIPSGGEGEQVLHYGGSWSSRAGAGLFSFAAEAQLDDVYKDTAGRMMFIK